MAAPSYLRLNQYNGRCSSSKYTANWSNVSQWVTFLTLKICAIFYRCSFMRNTWPVPHSPFRWYSDAWWHLSKYNDHHSTRNSVPRQVMDLCATFLNHVSVKLTITSSSLLALKKYFHHHVFHMPLATYYLVWFPKPPVHIHPEDGKCNLTKWLKNFSIQCSILLKVKVLQLQKHKDENLQQADQIYLLGCLQQCTQKPSQPDEQGHLEAGSVLDTGY
jgi:hypothetical protein